MIKCLKFGYWKFSLNLSIFQYNKNKLHLMSWTRSVLAKLPFVSMDLRLKGETKVLHFRPSLGQRLGLANQLSWRPGPVFTNIGGLRHKNLRNFKTFVLPKFWHKSVFTKGYFDVTYVNKQVAMGYWEIYTNHWIITVNIFYI